MIKTETNSLKPPLTVSQITQQIQNQLEEKYDWIQIRGEISNYKRAPSGHAYFSLKDDNAILNCVAWRGSVARWSSLGLEDGLEIIAGGKITVYPPRGQYQLVVSSIRLAGMGALQHRFETLKRILAEEGLFAAENKKPLPFLPRRIALITSPGGAAVRDFLRTVRKRRIPARITVCPVMVQGEQAAPQIETMIDRVNRFGIFDLIVLCRGGGSLEDLWAFNEENVARAIFRSRIPVLTGIGHEIDFTIADFTADHRASTPTGAAQTICTLFDELRGQFEYYADRLTRDVHPVIKQIREKLELTRKALLRYHPSSVLSQRRQRLDELQLSLIHAMKHAVRHAKSVCVERQRVLGRSFQHCTEVSRQQIQEYTHLLNSYNPANTLRRGYAICYKKDGAVVSTIQKMTENDTISVRLSDGNLHATVNRIKPHESEHEKNEKRTV